MRSEVVGRSTTHGVRASAPARATDSNGVAFDGYDPAASLKLDTDLLQLGLAGNLKAYQFRSQVTGQPVTGAGVDYKGHPAGYADQPDEVITYVDAHDNETLFDALTYKLPVATSMADRVRMNTLSLSTTALAQTPSFWHAGADLLRSKSLARDSYNAATGSTGSTGPAWTTGSGTGCRRAATCPTRRTCSATPR